MSILWSYGGETNYDKGGSDVMLRPKQCGYDEIAHNVENQNAIIIEFKVYNPRKEALLDSGIMIIKGFGK